MSSPYSGFIRYTASTSFAQDEPVDVSRVRDYLYCNSLHLADQNGQQRVNWVAKSSGAALAYDSNMDQLVWNPIWTSGEFPLSVQDTGESYMLRCYINAKSSGATNVYWRLVLHASDDATSEVTADGPNFLEYKTNSTTTAWLDPYAGSTYADHTLRMVARRVRAAMRPKQTFSDVSGTYRQTVSVCSARLTLFGYHTSSAVGSCYGVYACELYT